jgi:hypothetical protein
MPPPLSLARDFLITFPAVNIFIVSLSYAVGIPITSAHILLSLLPCLVMAIYWNYRPTPRTIVIAVFLLAVLFFTAIFLSIMLIDIYGDSRSYHGPAVIALSDGWNPYYDWQVCSWDDDYCIRTSKFIDHYPKAQWYISAEFYSLFGNLDVGKCMNLLMLVLCSLVAYEIARSLLPDRRVLSLMVAMGVAANPVAVAQLFSGTVDGILSSTLSIFILLLIGYFSSREKKYIHQAMLIMIFNVNLKFTGLIYATFFTMLIVLIILWFQKAFPRYLVFCALSTLFVSVLIGGFNPYLTNLILERNPFAEAVNIESGSSVLDRQADPEFTERNRVEKFIISTFSVGKKSDPKTPEFAFPLSRWKLNRGIAVRFSGFGPLFSAIFIVAIFQAARLRDGPSIALIFCVLLTAFSTSAGWWPRLAPQTWLVVCLVQLFVLVSSKGAVNQSVAYTVLAAMILNSGLVFAGVFSHQQRSSARFYRDLRVARARGLPVVVTDNRFGLLGFYNRRKLVDSLESEQQVVVRCVPRRENRIFGICVEPQPHQ